MAMGQGLKTACNTFSRFRQLVFGAIPEESKEGEVVKPAMKSAIGDHGDCAFDGLIDDSYGGAKSFEDMCKFLHEVFFPRCAFGPHYLKPSKSFFFFPNLEFVGLQAGTAGLRPSLQKRDMILNWATPKCAEEVEAFCYLTPFLRRFIPGRAELVRILKGEKDTEWAWTEQREIAFCAIKHAIANNAMAPADNKVQFHLACDASKRASGAVLFQLPGISANTEATSSMEHREKERIVMFMSFRFKDAETRYSNSEREALAVVRGLAEVKWLVSGSPYPTMVYTDHEALKTLLVGSENDAHGRIARWQERLGEYNFRLFHRKAEVHFIGIADGMSRLPTRWMQQSVAHDEERALPKMDDDPSSFEKEIPRVRMVCADGFEFEPSASAEDAMVLRRTRSKWGARGESDMEKGKMETKKKEEEEETKSDFVRYVHPVFRLAGGDLNDLRGTCVAPDMLFPDLLFEQSFDFCGLHAKDSYVCGCDPFLISPVTEVGTYVFCGDWFNGMQVVVKQGRQMTKEVTRGESVKLVRGAEAEVLRGDGSTAEGKGKQEKLWREWRMLCEKWSKWLKSGFYRKVVLYKLGGLKALMEEDVGKQEVKMVIREACQYVLMDTAEARLFYRERNGELAGCVVEGEVAATLGRIHDNHGHFAHGITTNNAVGHSFWPTRAKDVQQWIRSCDACQRVSKLQRSDVYNPIVQFKPFDMIGMDYIGPITPACPTTGCRYILVVIDYFTRFVFARPVLEATGETTNGMMEDHIAPVFGWPKVVYTDNGGHFVGQKVRTLLRSKGVVQLSAPITHPSSVGLAERYVNMVMGRIRLYCIARGGDPAWSLHVQQAVIDINTRLVKIHGCTPAELLLGFNPMSTRCDDNSARGWLLEHESPEAVIHAEVWQASSHLVTKDDRRRAANQRLVKSQDRTTKKASLGFRGPKAGDLVIVKDHSWFGQRGRKLDARWKHSKGGYNIPFIVERVSNNGSSAYIRGLHDPPGHTKRWHVEDLRVYVSRDSMTFPIVTKVSYGRDAFGSLSPGTLGTGQRAFDLSDVVK
jgi:hypothetical protein